MIARSKHVASAAAVLRGALGDHITDEYVAEYVNRTDEQFGPMFIFMSDCVAGGALTIEFDDDGAAIISDLAVAPHLRREGWGIKLVEEAVEAFGHQTMICHAWQSNEAAFPHAHTPLVANGFRAFDRIADYYDGQPCPVCGDECRCAAVVYIREPDGQAS